MADTKITSKSEFATAAATLKTKLSELKSDADSVKSKAKSANDYDGINVSGPASTLSSNFDNIYTDFETATMNINNYATDILGFDVNDFLAKGGETTVSYDDLFNSDGSMEGNAKVVWNFLKYKGLSDAAAAGVLGNIQAECSFRLNADGDGGTSYGLIQWHAGRKTALLNWLDEHGYAHDSLRGQLEYLWYEALDPNSHYGPSLSSKGFYTTNSEVDAAVIFHDVVERSASSAETVRNKRGGYASNWYSKFNGTGPGNVDGSLTLSSKKWTSLLNGKTTNSNTGAYTNTNSSSPSSSSNSYSSSRSSSSSSSSSDNKKTSTTSITTTTNTEDKTDATTDIKEEETTTKREDLINKMEELKATKIKLNFGSSGVDTSKFSDNADLGLKVTTGHMSYGLSDDDIDLLCSIVAASGGKGYDDSLSIISTILNRCENSTYMLKHGVDPIAQATGSGEFSAYTSGDFKSYLNGSSKISSEVREAVKAALSGIRNHNSTSLLDLSGKGSATTLSGKIAEIKETVNELTLEQHATETEVPVNKPKDEIEQQIDRLLELDELGIKVEDNTLKVE